MIIEGKLGFYRKKIEKLYKTAEELLGEDFSDATVSVNFVKKAQIKALNAKFRDKDAVTDVLSFPNLNKAAKQKLTDFEAEKVDGQLFLGDIVICKKRAKQQAKEYGHGKNREICFLALHGFLHLLGYDHIEKADEKLMQKTAEKILAKLGANR